MTAGGFLFAGRAAREGQTLREPRQSQKGCPDQLLPYKVTVTPESCILAVVC
jgi:hypothetical protein